MLLLLKEISTAAIERWLDLIMVGMRNWATELLRVFGTKKEGDYQTSPDGPALAHLHAPHH